jgi:hypothetical protein
MDGSAAVGMIQMRLILLGLSLLALGCARVQAIDECQGMGIQYGYYSGSGAGCVDAKLNPGNQEMVAAFSQQACARARAINSFDQDDACRQASLEAENAAWRALAAQPADSPPTKLSIDTPDAGLQRAVRNPESSSF